MTFKHSKWQYIFALCAIVLVVYLFRAIGNSISFSNFLVYGENILPKRNHGIGSHRHGTDTVAAQAKATDRIIASSRKPLVLFNEAGNPVRNRVVSVPDFKTSFPDINDVQFTTAQQLGISQRVKNREAAENQKDELVFIGDNPFYRVEKLNQSIPYLTPRAARLLETIGRAFMDSCMTKGVGMHKIVVTSVLRTQEDVDRLRRYNVNASENSCHLYGTTFDIGYNKYDKINNPTGEEKPTEWGVKLKSILAEVLADQRKQGTCYIKYEYKKPCFHITAR